MTIQTDMLGDHTSALPKTKLPDNFGFKRPSGYAAVPGTGPEGEKCRTCAKALRRCIGKTPPRLNNKSRKPCNVYVWKCAASPAFRLKNQASDISPNSPACVKFTRKANG